MPESIQAMRERRHSLTKEARQLIDRNRGKNMPAADEKRFNEILAESDRIEDEINREQRMLDAEAERSFAGHGQPSSPTAANAETSRIVENGLRRFLQGDTQALSMAMREAGIRNDMSEDLDPAGGYSVISELEPGISQILLNLNPFRQFARIREIARGHGAYEEVYSKDRAGAAWVTETGGRTDTANPDLLRLRVPLLEMYAMPTTTQRFADDASFNVIEWLKEQVGSAMGETESKAFVLGTEKHEPRGILTYPTAAEPDTTRAWGTIEHVATGVAGDFDTANAPGDVLFNCVGALKRGYRANSRWFMNRATEAAVRKLKDGMGNYLWSRAIAANQPNTLLGYPVVLHEDFPDIGPDALAIGFGDLDDAYQIIERPGLRFLLDPYTAKPYVRIYVYHRVGGDVRDFNAFKVIKFAVA